MSSDIEARLARLEAMEEIRALRHRYARICDAGRRNPDQLRTIFTDDVVFDGGETFGRHSGLQAVLDHARRSNKRFVWNVHYLSAPMIDVAADLSEATGSWYLWEPSRICEGDSVYAAVVIGSYLDRYRRVAGEWRIAEVNLEPITIAPYPSWEL